MESWEASMMGAVKPSFLCKSEGVAALQGRRRGDKGPCAGTRDPALGGRGRWFQTLCWAPADRGSPPTPACPACRAGRMLDLIAFTARYHLGPA